MERSHRRAPVARRAGPVGAQPAAQRRRPTRRRMMLSLVASALALLAFAPGALASTVSSPSGSGSLVYTPSSTTAAHDVRFGEPAPNTVNIRTYDADAIDTTTLPSNCTANTPGNGATSDVTCTGISQVQAHASSDTGNDSFTGQGDQTSPATPALADITTTFNGGSGNDALTAGNAGSGSSGCFFCGFDNALYGGDGNDVLTAGSGPVYMNGGNGDDKLTGGSADDVLDGGPGNDTLNGNGGDDVLFGDQSNQGIVSSTPPSDNDVLNGGDGNDTLDPSNGANQVSGGNGIDQVVYVDNAEQGSGPTFSVVATPVNVSLDGQANDGYAGNNSNIGSDVEDVSVFDNDVCSNLASGTPCAYGAATLTGSSGPNSLSGGSGDDTINGGGGADFLSGNLGNNTINAADGYPDRVDCGGTGTANVDQFDTVYNCTKTNPQQLTSGGLVSKAPTIAWTAPKEKAKLSLGARTPLAATVTQGSNPISQVIFYVGERMVCVVKTAPYTCSYTPPKSDIGKDTLIAVVDDSAGLSASATRTVNVSPFNGKLQLKGTKLTVRKGKVSAKFKCASSLPCKFRFSIDITAKVTKTRKKATVLFTKSTNGVRTIKPGKTATVTDSVTSAALSLLRKAKGNTLSGTLSTKPRSPQAGTVKKVKLVLK